MNGETEAVLRIVSFGALSGVMTVLEQSPATTQTGSPPPVTLAVLVTDVPAAAVGVIGMMKLAEALTARPAGIVQVTVCSATVQPVGIVPIVRPVGITSVMIDAAVVAVVPVLVTVIV